MEDSQITAFQGEVSIQLIISLHQIYFPPRFLATEVADDLRKLILEIHSDFLSPDGYVSVCLYSPGGRHLRCVTFGLGINNNSTDCASTPVIMYSIVLLYSGHLHRETVVFSTTFLVPK